MRDAAANALMYVCNRIVSQVPSHTLRLAFYRHVMRFEIGPGSSVLLAASFDRRGGFRLGRGSTLNQDCRVDTRGGVWVGDHVSISAGVTILTADHDLRSADFAGRARPVRVEDFAFVGTGATILPGVTLGRGSAVAAGSVVTRDVPPQTIVAGVPARPIGTRPAELAYTAVYRRLFH